MVKLFCSTYFVLADGKGEAGTYRMVKYDLLYFYIRWRRRYLIEKRGNNYIYICDTT